MFIYTIWLFQLGLISMLIGVAIWRRFFKKYMVFYLYLTFVLAVELPRYYVYAVERTEYFRIYWWTEFPIVAAGFCVTWEIFNHALQYYPGVLRMARFLVSSVFITVVGQASISILNGHLIEVMKTVMRLERNVYTVQAVLLAFLVTLIVYYSIPLGRNLLGLLCGYCLYVGTNVVMLTLRSTFGLASQYWLDPLRQTCFLVAMLIWAATLWRLQPNPKPAAAMDLEQDYAALALQTVKAIRTARGHILRMFVP